MFLRYFVHFTCILSLCNCNAPTPWDMLHMFDDSKSNHGDYADENDDSDLEVGELYLTVFQTNKLLGVGEIKIKKAPKFFNLNKI